MAGLGGEGQAGQAVRGHMRASHADREQVVGKLQAAFVQGRLTKDELDERAGQALASRTYAELAAVTADIPAGVAEGRPPGPARAAARRPGQPNVRSGTRASVATAAIAALLCAAFILTGSITVLLVAGGAFATSFVASFLTATQMLGSWLDNRSRRQPPPPPAAGQLPQAG